MQVPDVNIAVVSHCLPLTTILRQVSIAIVAKCLLGPWYKLTFGLQAHSICEVELPGARESVKLC